MAVLSSLTDDWDGSHDYSGYSDDLLAFMGHGRYMDVQLAAPIHHWPMFGCNPWWEGVPDPISPVLPDYYIDEGDYLTGDEAFSFAGWTPEYTSYAVAMNVHPQGLSSLPGRRMSTRWRAG